MNKSFKEHIVAFLFWIYDTFRGATGRIFDFTGKWRTQDDQRNRQWFHDFKGDKRNLERLIKWGLLVFTIISFSIIIFVKRPQPQSSYTSITEVNRGIISPSRNLDSSDDNLSLLEFDFEINDIPPLEKESSNDILTEILREDLSDVEREDLRERVSDLPGTRQDRAKREALLDPETPEVIRRIIRDDLRLDSDGMARTISDAYISSDRAKREAAVIVSDPSSQRDVANYLTEYLRNRLSSDEEDNLAFLRFGIPLSDHAVRDAAISLLATRDANDLEDALTLTDYLRMKDTASRQRAIDVLQRHFPELADRLFNENFPPNRAMRIAKELEDLLRGEVGKLLEEGYTLEESLFRSLLDQKGISLDEYDLLKSASRDTRDKNLIYDNLFEGYRLPSTIQVKGNEDAIARLAMTVGNPEIRDILERLLRGEDLSDEEILALKKYLAEHDPQLFIDLFGRHAYEMFKLQELLSDRDIQERVRGAIDLARDLGYHREAELLDRLLAGEDLTEEELEQVARFLSEHDGELYEDLFGDTEMLVDSTGRVLSRSELEALRRLRERGAEGSRRQRQRTRTRRAPSEENGFVNYEGLAGAIGEERMFTADQSFRAMLDTHVVLSDQEGSINYRYQLTLYDDLITRRGKMVAPRGSVITGLLNSGNVNFDTKIMSITTQVVSVHDRDIPINFMVGSGDGAMGVRGQVWDHKEKKWVGMVVTSFGAGITDTMNQIIQRDLVFEQDVITIPTAMPSIFLGGVTEVLTKISEDIGQELQNAPRFFQVEPQTPVILYPGL